MDKVKIFLLCVYIICPFIDMYNGYVQMFLNSQTLVPVLFKTGIIVYSLKYILRFNKATVLIYIGSILFLCSFAYWNHSGYIGSKLALIKDVSKIVYPYSILVVLYAFKNRIDREQLLHYVLYFGLISSSSILLFDILGIGVHSYGLDYGYGTKGLFIAGNDIGLSLILSNCVVAYFLSTKGEWKYVVYNVIILAACLCIGSTAGIIGTMVSIIGLLVQPLFVRYDYSTVYHTYKKLLIVFGIPLVLFTVYSIINTDSYTMRKFNANHLLSGGARKGLEKAYYATSSNLSVADYLWGIGDDELHRRIGYYFSQTRTLRALEVDHLEVTGIYGLLLGGLLLLYPLIYFFKHIEKYIRFRSLFSFWMIIAILLFIFHGIFAGHAYTSISAMSVLVAFMYLADNSSTDNL